jgi:sugar phosphate isomerase/epimerase
VVAAALSVSQVTTLHSSFADDVRSYAEAGFAGIGIWEMKLEGGDDAEAAAELAASGLRSASAVPVVPSILPLPLLPGPEDPAERVEAYCRSLERLAPFEPGGVVCLTGSGEGRRPAEARATVVAGLKTIAAEAQRLGLRVGLEPYQRAERGPWSIVSGVPETIELIHEAGDPPALGIQFDVWHLWNSPTLEEDIAREIDRFVGVHVCDVRSTTRSWADRALPGDGVAEVGRILHLLDQAGWDGLYDVEVFSDDGSFGTAHADSLWAQPAADVLERVRASFERTWTEARMTAASAAASVRPRPPVSKEWR